MDTLGTTGLGVLGYAVYSLYDKKEKKFKIERGRSYLDTTVVTAATAVTGACLNGASMNHIHNKNASAYVESMSDEELERALVKMDLLAEVTPENDVKTI